MANSVKVPQKDGTITIRKGLREPQTWAVENHIVDVDEKDLSLFLSSVLGARETTKPAKPAAQAKDGE